MTYYHRKKFTGEVNNRRITCKLRDTKHYESKYHHCAFKPSVLDLFCCAGGAGYGYYAAGFNVTGVDIVTRKNYFADFRLGDAIEYLKDLGSNYNFIHASPPCQLYSCSTHAHKMKGKTYPDLVNITRTALNASGKPWVMENVMQAPLERHLLLRGEMFGLRVIRKRVFEFRGGFEWTKTPPPFTPISVARGEAVIIYGNASLKPTGHGNYGDPGRRIVRPDWCLPTIRQTWSYAMGINNYMTDREIAESIPPAYTQYIGEEVMNRLFR